MRSLTGFFRIMAIAVIAIALVGPRITPVFAAIFPSTTMTYIICTGTQMVEITVNAEGEPVSERSFQFVERHDCPMQGQTLMLAASYRFALAQHIAFLRSAIWFEDIRPERKDLAKTNQSRAPPFAS